MSMKKLGFKPNQKILESNGLKVRVPEFVQGHACAYEYDEEEQILYKICHDCDKRIRVMKLNDEGIFVDVHKESEIHRYRGRGESGYQTRCPECLIKYNAKNEEKIRQKYLNQFKKEGLIPSDEYSGTIIGSLGIESQTAVLVLSAYMKMDAVAFVDYVISIYIRENEFKFNFNEKLK